jgi:hypothetical protein
MAQGVALIAPPAKHNLAASPHIEPFKRWFTATGVIRDDLHPPALKSSHEFPHGAWISSGLAAMEWQHDDKSQDIEHHQRLIGFGFRRFLPGIFSGAARRRWSPL